MIPCTIIQTRLLFMRQHDSNTIVRVKRISSDNNLERNVDIFIYLNDVNKRLHM